MKKLVWVNGNRDMADAGLLEDSAQGIFLVQGGKYDGEMVEITTAKHNCGAYEMAVQVIDKPDRYENAMYGCWQNNHQRPESGDPELAQMLTLEYALA